MEGVRFSAAAIHPNLHSLNHEREALKLEAGIPKTRDGEMDGVRLTGAAIHPS